MNKNISMFDNISVYYRTDLKVFRVLFLELKHVQIFNSKHIYCNKKDIEIDCVFINRRDSYLNNGKKGAIEVC